MTTDDYKQIGFDFIFCPNSSCDKSKDCFRHVAYKRLMTAGDKSVYMTVNSNVVTGADICEYFSPNTKEIYALGIRKIFDNVLNKDVKHIKSDLKEHLGTSTFYKINSNKRLITQEEQNEIKNIISRYGYDRESIEFDSYEEHYSSIVLLYRT